MKPHEKLQAHWGDEPAFATTALSEAEVSAIERRLGVSFPPDFRDYVRFACPDLQEDDYAMDDATTWWPRARLTSIAIESPDHGDLNPAVAGKRDQFIYFADWLFWCGAWAIGCGASSERGRIVHIGGKEDPFVANSFAEFVDMYLVDWRDLF